MDRIETREIDCAVVGSGPAGLSAAVYLGRMRRSVLVIDDRNGRSLWSQTTRNYLGFPDGIHAADLRLIGRRQAARYGAQFLDGRVTTATREGERFRLRIEAGRLGEAGTDVNVARDEADGRSLGEVEPGCPVDVIARTVILATGVRDHFPNFPGRDECVGRSLFWCIICDGYEAQGCSVAVVGDDEEAVETALDLLEFTDTISIVAGRPEGFSVPDSRLADLAAAGIAAYPHAVAEYPNRDGKIESVVVADEARTRVRVDMVFAVRRPNARNALAEQLGLELSGIGQIVVDTEQHTNVPGVYAAGDVTSLHDHLVSAAVHEGGQAACAANYHMYSAVQKAPQEEEC